jgi:NhaC family Na+:H+ antiporter
MTFSAGGIEGRIAGTNLAHHVCHGFGGIMDAIGLLARISQALLNMTVYFGLFASTVASCLALNLTSDQYLAIVVPGKMFSKAYEERGLAPETESYFGRWNGHLCPYSLEYLRLYQSGVLGVSVFDCTQFMLFLVVGPFTTLLFCC